MNSNNNQNSDHHSAKKSGPRHFLSLMDLSKEELQKLLLRATALRAIHRSGELYQPLTGKTLGMIFSKSSTRTRVSFEAGMAQLGGSALFLSPNDTQLGRGEPLADSARVLSRMVSALMVRNDSQADLEELAAHSSVPVINALTERFHPCQLLADMQCYREQRGDIAGRKVAFIGDGNNVCNSYINAARLLEFNLHIATPAGFEPPADLVEAAGNWVTLTNDAREAVTDADLVVTDVWASMGQEAETEGRHKAMRPYQVNEALMALAKTNALFMHCLPAHRGEEVTAGVIDGPQSVVWDEAENRLHAQKALLELLLVG